MGEVMIPSMPKWTVLPKPIKVSFQSDKINACPAPHSPFRCSYKGSRIYPPRCEWCYCGAHRRKRSWWSEREENNACGRHCHVERGKIFKKFDPCCAVLSPRIARNEIHSLVAKQRFLSFLEMWNSTQGLEIKPTKLLRLTATWLSKKARKMQIWFKAAKIVDTRRCHVICPLSPNPPQVVIGYRV